METPSASWNPAELTAHTEWVRGLALQLVKDSAQADDLVQETFLAALERQPGQGRSLKPWLRRVLHNRFAFGKRSDARRLTREEDGASPEALPPSDELVENAEAHALLVRELTKLREPYRTALLLRYFEGKTPQEIAQSQGVPAATVRSHLKRGLDELRERLDRRHGGGRRVWSLALIPLAAASRDAIPPGGAISSLTQSIRAMNPLTQVLVGSTLLLASAAFVAQQIDLLPPGESNPAAIGAIGGGTSPPATIDGGAVTSAGNRREAAESSSTVMASTSEDEKITGVVIDAKSGVPLPDFALEFQLHTRDAEGKLVPADEDAEEVRTDEEGSFTTERTYAAGTVLGLTKIDHRGMYRVIRSKYPTHVQSNSISALFTWNPEVAPLQLSAGIGPMFALTLTAPFDWRSTELIGYLEPVEDEPWSVLENCSSMRGPVRGESSPWVRFGSILSQLPADRPWRLRVETPDGLFSGEAQVAAGEGIYPETVPITLVPTAKLMVNLISETGVATSTVVIQAVNGNTRRVLLGGVQKTRDDGLFQCCRVLHAIPPGEYDLLVTCEGAEPVQETVTLFAGEVLSHDIEIQHGPDLSHVHGELRSESGQYQESVTLWLTHRETGISKYAGPKWVERDGEWVAPFEFANLIAGEYDLIFFSLMGYYRWDPLPVTVSPPHEELILTCHDTDPVRTLKFRVTDADTEERVGGAYAYLTLEGCATSQTSMGTIFPQVPVDRPMVWWLIADGYLPQWGDENDISGTEPFKDEVLNIIEVALEPGWGARIEARELASREPLAGVEVLVDDEVAGVTDSEGMFELILEEPPLSVELRRDGWRFVRGPYDDDAHELTGVEPTRRVLFEPDA